jgi:hypothetical protein
MERLMDRGSNRSLPSRSACLQDQRYAVILTTLVYYKLISPSPGCQTSIANAVAPDPRFSTDAVGTIITDRPPQSGRTVARSGLRMMPTFPPSPLSFRTAGFPQYGWKAGMSDGAFPMRQMA